MYARGRRAAGGPGRGTASGRGGLLASVAILVIALLIDMALAIALLQAAATSILIAAHWPSPDDPAVATRWSTSRHDLPSLGNCSAPVRPHTDWMGTDILPDDKPLYTTSAAECCEACANHTTSGTAPCMFWSRFTSSQRGRCYLKTAATDRHTNKAMEAGSIPGAPNPPFKPHSSPHPAGPPPPPPPSPPAPPQTFTVDLSSELRVFHKPFLECVGSSHMAMGLLENTSASGPTTAGGQGIAKQVGQL